MNIVTEEQRSEFIAKMNAKWQRKYEDYQKWLTETEINSIMGR